MKFYDLISEKETLEERLAIIETDLAKINANIEAAVADALFTIREAQGKQTGAVSINHNGFIITQTIPKKVTWDQEKIKDVVSRIKSAGDNPDLWVKTEYKISENDYKAWSEAVRSAFRPARTVTPGKPKLSIKSADIPF